MYGLLRAGLFCLPPEQAHCLAVQALTFRLKVCGLAPPPVAGSKTVMGLNFANPVGLAAGFDKDGAHIDAIATLGFGFIEIGGVTPQPQPGNPAPRIFRLPAAEALINRMGLNSAGAAAVAQHVARAAYSGIIGINIGKNAATTQQDAVQDYIHCLTTLYEHGDFFVLNVSSPNTKNLRDLQHKQSLTQLLTEVIAARDALATKHQRRAPIAVKIAPDLSDAELEDIAAVICETGTDGVVAVNTTIARPPQVAVLAAGNEQGGLSGKPLAARATEVIARLRALLPADTAIIGVGGIASAADAQEKLNAGADLVQLYTGLIYRGAQLPMDIINTLR